MNDNVKIQKYQAFKNALQNDDVKKRFEQILADRSETFLASLLTVVANNDKLKECSVNSILTAAAKAAILNLPIEAELGQAHIVPYKETATFIAGYKGLIQLALRTGQYKFLNVAPVYQGEEVVENRLTGEITINGNQSGPDVIGYAGYFQLKNGFEKYLYMSKDDIHAHAERFSPSYKYDSSPWKTHTTAMEKKTVLRLLLMRWGLMSIQMQDTDSPPLYEAPSGEELTVPNFDDAIDGEARDADQPSEPAGELAAGAEASSWDKAWIDAYLENNIAQHPKQAVNILNKLQPANKTEAVKLGKVYRGFRDKYEKMSSDEAAAKTLKGEKP